MSEAHDWRDIFCGRVAELKRLERAYRAVAEGAGPRYAVVLGDRGMGKTRLVQELYRILTDHHDPYDYWPDARLFEGDNLRVAPAPGDFHFAPGERLMPFLWWGFRLNDPSDRNAPRADMAAHRATLEPHLSSVLLSRRLAELTEELKGVGAETGKSAVLKLSELIPVIGPAACLVV